MIKFKKHYFLHIGLILILISLIVAPSYTFNAAKEGLLLWFNVIIPSLLPFIIVSNLFIQFNLVQPISQLFATLMNRLFHLPGIAGYPWLIGLLSGYPMGAKMTADLLKKNYLTLHQAQYLLTFCNNASPMFVLGFVSVGILDVGHLGFYLLVILFLSSLITGLLFRFIYQPEIKSNGKWRSYQLHSNRMSIFSRFDQCIMDGIDLIVRIGGYIIFFSIVLNLTSIIPIQPLILKNFMLGTIEISNGIHLLAKTPIDLMIQVILVNTLIAFGGFSIHAQTASVLQGTGLSFRKYLIAKIVQGFITFCLTLLFFLFLT